MPLKIYNTLSHKKEVLEPLKDNKVNLFVCGVTPYDFAHLGHARVYVFFDFLKKYLASKGYKVFYLQNVTDVDDKIIQRSEKEKISWKELSNNFRKEYIRDIKSLRINSVDKYAKATDHIKEIISQIKRLLEKGYAYQTSDGVYYDVSKFKEYGKLSGRINLKSQDAVSRIDESINKKNKKDFCLWKISKKNEPKWQSPWGLGRPGWHIEDTAITEKYFGPQYDIHGGGRDLIFPHHEAEIAQMEAVSGKKPLAKYWMHVGFLTVEGKKMSKSLGNFITIKNFTEKYSARILRYFILKHHYRSPINYSDNLINQAKKELERIDEFVEDLKNYKPKNKTKESNEKTINLFIKNCEKELENDFNTPKLIAQIFKFSSIVKNLITKQRLSGKDKKTIVSFISKLDKSLCFIYWKEKIPKEIIELARKRLELRLKKEWKMADEIREKIKSMGFLIQDTENGFKIKKI